MFCPLAHHPGITHINYKFTSRCLFETPTVGMPGRGLCAFQTRPRMANHDISWVPGAHVRFGTWISSSRGEESCHGHTPPSNLFPPTAFTMRGLGVSSTSPMDHGSPGRSSIASPLPMATSWRDLLERDTSLRNDTHGAPRRRFRSVSTTPRRP